MGYTTHNSILNLSSIGLIFMVYFIRLMVLALLIAYTKMTNKCRLIHKYKSNLQNALLFNELINLLIEGCFEFLIAGFLQIKFSLYTTNGEVLAVFVGYGGIIGISLVLSIIIFF